MEKQTKNIPTIKVDDVSQKDDHTIKGTVTGLLIKPASIKGPKKEYKEMRLVFLFEDIEKQKDE